MKTYQAEKLVIFAVKNGETKREIVMNAGEVIELPEDDISVRAMLARKQIREVPDMKAKKQIKQPAMA